MSEMLTNVISFANNLTSPKAVIKYLSIAVSLIFSWVYVHPFLSQLDIPVEQLSLIVLLLGVGLGSLLGFVISWVHSFFWEKHKQKKEEELALQLQEDEAEKLKEEKEAQDAKTIQRLKDSINHLPFTQLITLRMLTKTNRTFDYRDNDPASLISNNYIQKISKVGAYEILAKINPIVHDTVVAHLNEHKKTTIENFFRFNENAEEILSLLEVSNSESLTPVSLNTLRSLSSYSECIKCKFSEDDGYWVFFDIFMLDAMEEKTGRKYQDEVNILLDRIVEP